MGTKRAKVKLDSILKNLWGIEVGYWETAYNKSEAESNKASGIIEIDL